MAVYRYEATDPGGRIVRGSLEARDEGALAVRLREMGYLPIELNLTSDVGDAGDKGAPRGRLGRVNSRDVANLTQSLSGLLEAGFPLDRSLSLLAGLGGKPALSSMILRIKRGVEAGRPLSDCLSDFPKAFSSIYVSMVKAGGAGGAMEAALRRIHSYMEDSRRIKDEITSALIYPSLLLAAGGAAILVMIFFVTPAFTEVFAEMGGEVPLAARALLFINRWAPAFFLAIAVAAALSYMALR